MSVFGGAVTGASTIPQWRGDLRLAMTVIKVARGGGEKEAGLMRPNLFVMNH